MNPQPPPLMQSPPGALTIIDGREYLYFVGTGYLGLQGRAEVIQAACDAARKYGVGSGTTRTGYGTTPPLLEVERLVAELTGAEDALYLPSGYASSQVAAAALADACDAVVIDELSHYCLFEAARATGRPIFRFAHCDPAALRTALAENIKPGQRPLLLSDGVFAARGDVAPAAAYEAVLCDWPGASLLIDDAHGLGVLGGRGRGTLEHAGLFNIAVNDLPGAAPRDRPALYFCGTLSKALGGYGGVLPGSRRWIARLKAASHWHDGASPVPPPVAAASARAIELALAEPELRVRLGENVRRLRRGLGRLGLDCGDSPAPIVCLSLGTADNMRRIQSGLMDRGILVAYMSAYAGLPSEGALRLAVFAVHATEMVDQLLDALSRLV